MKHIAIVIINYHDYSGLESSLQSFMKCTIPENVSVSYIVVDQESVPNEVDLLRKRFPQMHLIQEKRNFGVGGSFNLGIQYALTRQADFVLSLPADTIVDLLFIQELYNHTDETIGITGGKLITLEKPHRIIFAGGILDKRIHSSIHWHNGELDNKSYKEGDSDILNCPILIRKEVFEKIGFWQEKYFMYYEDVDFYLRTKKAGFRLVFTPSALAYTPAGMHSELSLLKREYYLSRNLLYFNAWNYSLIEQFIAYCYIVREAGYLFQNLFYAKKRKRAQMKLIAFRDFLLRRIGKKDIT